jgi:F-type H+-transporting ATPase subunit epsilon
VNVSIMTPVETMEEKGVAEITAESSTGHFGMLPRHIDFITDLVPGMLCCRLLNGDEMCFAVDEGVLVKKSNEVYVSVRRAIKGGAVGTLKDAVVKKLGSLNEQEKKSRAILAKLEADFMRRFLEIK